MTSQKRKRIVDIAFKTSIALFAALMLLVVTIVFSFTEGLFFPVTNTIQHIQMVEEETGWTQIKGSFTKYRDCSISDLRWFYGNPDDPVYARTRIPTQIGIRNVETGRFEPIPLEPGEQVIENVRVYLPANEIQRDTYSMVYHRCWGSRLWETETLFWQSEKFREE